MFTDQPKQTPPTSTAILKEKKAISSKDVRETQKSMDIAKERGMALKEILSYDLLSSSPLFYGDVPAHVNKSKVIIGEIEPGLDLTKWSRESTLATHVIVDFMSKMRQMSPAQLSTLGDVIIAIVTSASNLCRGPDFIHLVLDSYVEMSLKEGERLRRSDEATGIDIIGMSRDTPISKRLDKFWASEANKQNLQLLVRDIVCNQACVNPTITASSVVSDDEAVPAVASGNEEIPELLNWIEKADARLVAYVERAVRVKQCQRVVVMSNHTDTFALLLHFTPHFQALGL